MKKPQKTAKSGGSSGAFRRLAARMKKYWPLLVLSLLLAVASVILQIYIPVLFGNGIDQVVAEGRVDFTGLWYYLRQILVLAAAAALSAWLLNLVNNRMTYKIVQDLRLQAIRHIQRLPLSYLDKHSVGDLVSRVIADADTLSDGLLLGFSQLFSGVVTVVVTLVFMFSKNLWITLLVILLTPLSFLVARFISGRSFRLFQKQSETRGRQTALIEEMIGNQKVVQAFGYEKRSSARFAEVNGQLQQCSQQAVFYSSLTNPSTRCINSIIYAGVTLIGAFLIPKNLLTVGGLSVLLAYASQYMKPFNDISAVITEMQNALACAWRIFSLLEEPEERPDSSSSISHVQGQVDIDGLEFSYDKKKPLIENFSLHAAPGMRIAIVGPTGCGKTTLINLLMRFYDADGGDIQIDGQSIYSLSRDALRSCFGMVLQDTWIKSGTVRENLCFGRPGATDEEIIRAAKEGRSWGFIQQLPQGLDTVLTEDSISQGQKQLLCISRVMLCLPPMLILDEATSSIDTRTELQVQAAFDSLMQGRTSFVVAHRLSTIRNADLILVMRDGKIIEQGRHETLLAQGGFYSRLYNSQFQNSAG